jgi:hypothetical protein
LTALGTFLLLLVAAAADAPGDVPGCGDLLPYSQEELAGSPELQGWLAVWRPEMPGLDAGSFECEHTGRFAPRGGREIDYSEYLKSTGIPWETQCEIVQISPDGCWALDHLIFQLYMDGQDVRIVRDVDSHVVLVDLDTMKAYFVAGGGTPINFHRPIWVDTDVFLVLFSVSDVPGAPPKLAISRFDIGAELAATFAGPPVERGPSSSAWARFRSWNSERYSQYLSQ